MPLSLYGCSSGQPKSPVQISGLGNVLDVHEVAQAATGTSSFVEGSATSFPKVCNWTVPPVVHCPCGVVLVI